MKVFVSRLGFCLLLFGLCLYSYLNCQNQLTTCKIELPALEKEIARLEEDNKRLVYEIEQFENPSHLMEMAARPEFSHLKHPLLKEILTVPEVLARISHSKR